MPIYPSVITGTKAHKHESSSATGGPIDVNSITLATGLTEGGIIQGDNGTGLTNLPIGNASDILSVNAGATGAEWISSPHATPPYELLDYHIASGTESTYTFTQDMDLDSDYQEIISYFNGKFSDSLILQANLNSISEHHVTITKNLLGTITGIHNGSATQIDLIDTAINNVARSAQCVIHYTKAQINATSSPFCYYGVANSPARATQTFSGSTVVDSTDTITDIEWLTSASSWVANTTITTFGLRK